MAETDDKGGAPVRAEVPGDPAGEARHGRGARRPHGRARQGDGGRPGGCLLLLAAVVPLPWALAYGAVGVGAVVRGASGLAAGSKLVEAGYSRPVSPGSLVFVGALLLAAFAVTLGAVLLLLLGRRSAAVWLPLLLVAGGLTAGSVWAAVRGDLAPVLWVVFFFGLVYATAVALLRLFQVTRAGGRGTMTGHEPG